MRLLDRSERKKEDPRALEIKKGAFERFSDGRSWKTCELISSDRQGKREAWKFLRLHLTNIYCLPALRKALC